MNESPLGKLIISSNVMIASNCNNFISRIPNKPALFQNYFRKLSFKHDSVGSFLTRAASNGINNFIESFNEFSSFFPPITLDLKSSPKRGNSTQYFMELMKLDWYSDLAKMTLNVYIQTIFTQFILKMIEKSETITEKEIEFILTEFSRYASQIEQPTNEFERITTFEIMYRWSFPINSLSKHNPELIWRFFEEQISEQSNSLFYQSLYFTSFSSMAYNQTTAKTSLKHFSNFPTLLVTHSDDHSFCTQLTFFIHNSLFLAFEKLDLKFDIALIKELFSVISQQTSFNHEAFNFIAHFSNFLTDFHFQTMDEFLKLFPKISTDLQPIFIKSIIYKLFGKNYSPIIEIQRHRTNFSWYIENSEPYLDSLIKFMINNESDLCDYGNELSEVVLQMMISNLPHFIDVILPKMDDYQATRTNICVSLYKGLQLFFSKLNYFKRLNPILSQENDRDYLREITEKAQFLVYTFLSKIGQNPPLYWYRTASMTVEITSDSLVSNRRAFIMKQIESITETSKPIFPTEIPIKDISTYTQQLGKMYYQKTIEKPEIPDFDTMNQTLNSDLQNVLSLSLYLDLNDDTLKLIDNIVLARSPINGATAMRCLQVLIHLHSDFAIPIINHLCDYFISNTLNEIALILIINALTLILEAVTDEQIVLPSLTLSKISFILILGLCVPNPSVHNTIFDICEQLSQSKESTFPLQNFFKNFEKEISFDAMRRASQSIMAISDTEVASFQIPTFHEVSLSNVPSLYLFYLSSFGRFILDNKQEFEYEIRSATKVLFNMFNSFTNAQLHAQNSLNSLALFLSIAENLDDFKISQIRRICFPILNQYSKDADEEALILLISIFSAMTTSAYQGILPLFTRQNLPIVRTVVFTTREMIKRNLFNCFQDHHLSNIIYAPIHSALIFSYFNCISDELTFEPGPAFLGKFSQYHLFLDDFGVSLSAIFKKIKKSAIKSSELLFICNKPQGEKLFDNRFNAKKWFIFFCNFTSVTNTNFNENLMSAFNLWLEISHIPDEYFDDFMLKLPEIGKIYPDISTTIFKINPAKLLPLYIEKARTNFHMFMAIANQIVLSGDSLENRVTEKIEFKGGDIETIYYQNCGSLIALSLVYMISKRINRRMTGLSFLSSLILIIGIFKKDPSTAAEIYKFIEGIKQTMLNSFTIFIERDFPALNALLASHFKFCGEQFADECFEIVSTRTNIALLANSTTNTLVNTSNQLNNIAISKRASTPNLSLSPFKSHQLSASESNLISKNPEEADLPSTKEPSQNLPPKTPSIAEQYSVRKTLNAVLDINLRSLLTTTQTLKRDQVKFEKSQILTSLISEWLNPISFDLQRIGISRDCEEKYRVFGIYSFVNGLLTLCSAQGMTQSLAGILDILIEHNQESFTLCLYDLQAVSESHAKSATLFFIYLYNKNPDAFIQFIREFLRVTCWFFYEIQISNDNLSNDLEMIQQSNDSQELNISHEIDYGKIINFTLNLIEECRKENSEKLADIQSYLLIFCLIHNSTFSDIADVLISNLTNLKPNQQSSLHSSDLKWKLDDFLPFINESERFLLEWGLTCGDLEAASKALQIYELKGYILPDDAVSTLLNAMQAVSSAMTERTDPARKSQYDNWMLRVTSGSTKSDYSYILNWLRESLKLLRRHVANRIQTSNSSISYARSYNEKNKLVFLSPQHRRPTAFEKPTLNDPKGNISQSGSNFKSNDIQKDDKFVSTTNFQAFWTAVSFLQCHNIEYSQLFVAALSIVDLFLSKSSLRQLLKERKESRIKGGLMPLLLSAKTQDAESINSIFSIISALVDKELIYLLSPNENASCVAILTLLPWIYMKHNRQGTSKMFASFLSSIVGPLIQKANQQDKGSDVITKFSNALMSIGFYETATASEVVIVLNYLIKCVKIDDLKMVFRFYSQALHIGSFSQKECIFIVCNEIIEKIDMKNMKLIQDEISAITYYTVSSKNTQNSSIVLSFLQTMAKRDFRVTNPVTKANTVPTIFPSMKISTNFYRKHEITDDDDDSIYLQKYDFTRLSEWEPNALDVFHHYSLYPPLYITDPSFTGSKYLTCLKKAIDKVVAVPFNNWSDLLFKAQLQNEVGHNFKKNDRFITIEVDAGEFVSDFYQDIGKKTSEQKRLNATNNHRNWLKNLDHSLKVKKQPLGFINPSKFYSVPDEFALISPR